MAVTDGVLSWAAALILRQVTEAPGVGPFIRPVDWRDLGNGRELMRTMAVTAEITDTTLRGQDLRRVIAPLVSPMALQMIAWIQRAGPVGFVQPSILRGAMMSVGLADVEQTVADGASGVLFSLSWSYDVTRASRLLNLSWNALCGRTSDLEAARVEMQTAAEAAGLLARVITLEA